MARGPFPARAPRRPGERAGQARAARTTSRWPTSSATSVWSSTSRSDRWKIASRPGLYLEMTDDAPDRLHAGACPRCSRSPAWSAPRGGRTRARPHRPAPLLDEFTLLGVYEVDDTFVAPVGPIAGITSAATPAGTGQPERPPHHRALARADQPAATRRRRRRCATGPTSCTSATSPRPATPASR